MPYRPTIIHPLLFVVCWFSIRTHIPKGVQYNEEQYINVMITFYRIIFYLGVESIIKFASRTFLKKYLCSFQHLGTVEVQGRTSQLEIKLSFEFL